MLREAMDICLRVLKESNKSRFDSYNVRNSILIISHITFRDCRGHIFFDNLSRNSCINMSLSWLMRKEGHPRRKKCAYTREIATRKTQHTTNQISAIFAFDCITSRKLKSAIFDFGSLFSARLHLYNP